jgi:DNA polymerase-4
MPRKILHLDLDAFFCAVEELHTPVLKGKPFAVGGRPDERGVVASCSYAARAFGVSSAMPMARALRICPELIIVSSHHGRYGDVSEQVMRRLRDLTPLVEQISIDEAFLDVSDLNQSLQDLAKALQRRIRSELSLPSSLGGAANKLVAKIATDVGKAAVRSRDYPNAIMVVPPGEEAAFLAPLPTRALWGVGPKTELHLAELGLKLIGDVARWPESDLAGRFGKGGQELARHARGLDDRPVEPWHETKSISVETTFVKDIADSTSLRRTLREQAEEVGRRLREAHLAGSTIKLKLRWPDFSTLSRQVTLVQATDLDDEIGEAVEKLFLAEWQAGRPVRLLGVGVSGLGPPVRQLDLFDTSAEKNRKLLATVDKIRGKYGGDAVKRGRRQ